MIPWDWTVADTVPMFKEIGGGGGGGAVIWGIASLKI